MQITRLLSAFAALVVVFSPATLAVSEETKTLDQLYQEAIQEGGKLVVYHGGDTPNQQDGVANAFREAFPKINLTMIVDYSKYHDVRVDNQLETKSLVADVIALQTLQDYPRWKKEGKLLNYKPAGFSKIYPGFVDPEGAWIAHVVFWFSYFYDEAQLKALNLPVPKTAKDIANPIYAGQISSTYPHDDDAALFVFAQYIDCYGWDWVAKMAKQNIDFRRGSDTAGELVQANKTAIGMAGSSPAVSTVKEIVGKDASSPYVAWGQRMSILKKAPHPAAAKLFLNWIISTKVQTTTLAGMSTRTDVKPLPGATYQWQIPQASSLKFQKWMEDRATIERLKATLALYFGEVQGKPTPGELGLHPGL